MPTNKKQRIEIPKDLKVDVLFASDRTCCVCRIKGKPTQIHHIDENPAHNVFENLAVLCFDCHNLTQIRGGFHNKLDAAQVLRYRDDWLNKVAKLRETWWQSHPASETKETEQPPFVINSRLSVWEERIFTKLKEFILVWTSIYGKRDERLVNPFLGDLKNKFSIMSEQLVIMLSESPKEASKEIVEDVVIIANQLSELGIKRFFLDGGKSAKEFNDLGDSTVKIAENILEQIRATSKEDKLV